MDKEFLNTIDIAINNSEIPLLITGKTSEDKLTFLNNNYKTITIKIDEINEFFNKENELTNTLIDNPINIILPNDWHIPPTWYLDIYKLCNENPHELCLVIFDGLENSNIQTLLSFLDNIIVNYNHNFVIPQNANIICTINSKDNHLPAPIVISNYYLPYFKVVKDYEDQFYDNPQKNKYPSK